MGFFPFIFSGILKLFCCSSLNFSLLFSSPNEYIIGQQVVPPHLTWSQWVQLAPMDLSFSLLVPGASGEVQGQETFGPGTAQPPASA